jgi:hypothetical protein
MRYAIYRDKQITWSFPQDLHTKLIGRQAFVFPVADEMLISAIDAATEKMKADLQWKKECDALLKQDLDSYDGDCLTLDDIKDIL